MLRSRRGRWLAGFVFWTVLVAFFSTQVRLYSLYAGRPMSWRSALQMQAIPWYAWGLLSPFILWLGSRFRITREHWLRSLAVLVPCGVLIVVAKMAVQIPLLMLLGTEASTKDLLSAKYLQGIAVANFHLNYLFYWIIIGASHGLHYYQRSRERELRASQLEAQLAQAQLESLKAQLHPHFLFNALHSISALIHRDPELADCMLSRLADLLRMALDSKGVQEVTLREELDFLTRYLQIEKMRLEERLQIKMNVDPAILDARVPNLILQPLVENAVRHGIAPRRQGGTLEVSGTRIDGRLELAVRDNGSGFPQGGVRDGLGFTNTRARLIQLYGQNQQFEISSEPGRGVEVRITIPYEAVRAREGAQAS